MTHTYSRLLGLLSLLAIVSLGPIASAVTLTWVGGGDANDFADLTNWTGTPTGGTIDTAALVDDYVVDDPTFNMTSAVRLNFIDDGAGNDGSLTFDQGTLDTGANGIGLLEAPDSFGTLTLNSGSVTAQFLAEMNVSLGGTGTLNLNGGGNPVNVSTINFTSLTSTLHFVAEDEAAFAAEHLSSISVEGVPAVIGANLLVVSDGATGVNVTATTVELDVTVDRQTGNILIANPSASGINIASYSFISAGGALDPTNGVWTSIADTGDLDSGGSIDSGSNWIEFTDPADRNNLSEAQQPGGGGLVLGAAGTINLGNAWIQNANEDVLVTLVTDAGTAIGAVVAFTGTEIPNGDMDFDGDVDATDWPLYRANLFGDLTGLSDAEAYQMGDLNGDGLNNELDFVVFKRAFEDNLGAGSFAAMVASVPEPSAITLVMLGSVAFLFTRKRKIMTTRFSKMVCLFVLVGLTCFASNASAVIVWTGAADNDIRNDANYDFSGSTLTTLSAVIENGGSTAAGVEDDILYGNAGIAPEVPNAAGQVNYGSMAFGITFDNVISTFAAGSNEGWRAATVSLINGSQTRGFFYVSSAVTMDATSSIILDGGGNPVNLSTIDMAPGSVVTFTAETVAAFNTEHLGKFTVSGAALVDGVNAIIASDGGAGTIVTALIPTDPLSLVINTDTGTTKIINDSGAAIDLDFYKLTSATNSLDLANWQSIENGPAIAGFPPGDGSGNGWEEAGGSNDGELGEAFLTGFSTLSDGNEIDLGSAFQQGTGSEDVALRYRDPDTGAFTDVLASYVTGGVIDGDYNGNGIVDAADYTLWRDNLGASITLAGENPAAATPGLVDAEDYAFWKSRFGATSGSGSLATSSVPEPSTALLALLGIGGAFGLARRRQGKSLNRAAMLCMVSATVVAWAVAGSTALATVTLDRDYKLGDSDADSGTPAVGAEVGSANSFGTTFDDSGTSGTVTLIDLEPNGSPTYANVSGRPLASGSTLGISFNGTSDYLQGARLGLPSSSISSVDGGQGGTLNYTGIANRGFQLWANPNSAGNGTAQSLVADTEQHGVQISAAGTWVLRYDGDLVDSGVAVNFNAWSHLMVVRPSGAAGGARLYVDGVAVAAEPGGYTGGDDTPLVVGANSGATPGTADFYNGVIDDLELFVLGTATAGPDYGTFSAEDDNEFLADALTGLTDGDLTGDGIVMGDGSGGAGDDVAVFVANWLESNLVNGIAVGDLNSRNMGDFDLDGDVDLFDWHVLRTTHVNGASLNLGALLAGTNVPEPSTLVLVGLAGISLLVARRRRSAA